MKKYLSLLLFLWLFGALQSQNISNFRVRYFSSSDTITLDTLTLIPHSVIIYDNKDNIIKPSYYQVDISRSKIIFDKSIQTDSLRICYRVFPILLSQKYKNSNTYWPKDSAVEKTLIVYSPPDFLKQQNLNNLQKTGYISRNINFGNNQNVVVNSALNVQLSGRLSNNIHIKAAITDNNIPIQPDGNTQQIQEFDKVFISLYNDNTNLTLGDFAIRSPYGYFLKTHKKLMGAHLKYQWQINPQKSLKIETTTAIAKGKFNRMQINGQEGVQGPYKLLGAHNESYIIILAGSEKVYVDGVLMQRGENNDYTIDYNLAEISFTTERLITKDSRIVVEFEYSDKNYAKFTVGNSLIFKNKKQTFWLNILSDHESKNQTLNIDYSSQEKNILYQAGDDPYKAVSNNFDSLPYNPNEIRYKMIDSLGYDSVFVYSTQANDAFYRVKYAFVGSGKGDYLQSRSSANGRVFRWIKPISGVHQGDYLPVKILITPKSQQMLTTGGDLHFKTFTHIKYEYALSQYDANTFSPKDAKDNTGMGFKIKMMQDILIRDTSAQKLQVSFSIENTQKNFTYFENFRSVEFNRDWNIRSGISQTTTLLSAQLLWQKRDWGSFIYQLKKLDIKNEYEAYRHRLTTTIQKNKFRFNGMGSYMDNYFTSGYSRFYRTKARGSFDASFLTFGLDEEMENNQWYSSFDSLQNNSYAFTQWGGFVKNAKDKAYQYQLSYKQRQDKGAKNNALNMANESQTISFNNQLTSLKNQHLSANITWREVLIKDSTISKVPKKEETLIGKIEHSIKFLRNALSFRTFYELSSGLELKKEFAYIEVAPGQGIYQWIDYNNNGLQELNEFERATYNDQAKYIRVFVPSNTYIRAYASQLTETIHLYPYKIWRNKKGIRGFIARFNNLFSYKISRKNKELEMLQNLNPLDNSISDSSLLKMNYSLRNTLSFNKINSIWGLDYVYINYSNKSLLFNGFDMRTHQNNALNLRFNINDNIRMDNHFEAIKKSYYSDFFSTNNYDVQQWGNKVQVITQVNNNLRLSVFYYYKDKKNTMSFQKAFLHQIGSEIKYSHSGKSNLSVTINYFNFNYNDLSNTPVAFEMLEGLLPGNNAQWGFLYQINISRYLQLNLNYLGRVSEEGRITHNGQAQLRAVF